MIGVDRVIVLEIHASGQVEKERIFEVVDSSVRINGRKYSLNPKNILHREEDAYVIYLTGLGFALIGDMSNSLM